MTSELQTSSEINKFFDDYTKLFDARARNEHPQMEPNVQSDPRP